MTHEGPTRATLVGAGGLGGPIALSLGAAGIELAIFDHDVVELSNLHRQIQFTTADLTQPKASRLAGAVVARGGRARGVLERWRAPDAYDTSELAELTNQSDIIIDASDDPATKFAVADWAVANGRQYVIAAALRYGGNVMAGVPGVACYRCLFEEPAEDGPTCADAGVLGPVVGALGGVAAAVALALIRGQRSLAGALLVFDDLRMVAEPRIVRFAPRADCPSCRRAPISPIAKYPQIAESI